MILNDLFKIKYLLLLSCIFFNKIQCQNIHIKSAKVWDGENFNTQDIFIVNGVIENRKPIKLDTVIGAKGKYLLPAFGDYHTHAFTYNNVERIGQGFISNGIFYAQDLANDPIGRLQNRTYLEKKNTIDVNFANGCITTSYGHPIEGYERMAMGVRFPTTKAGKQKILESRIMEGRAYLIMDHEDKVEEVMNRLLSTQPDLVKVILWDSENYDPANPKLNKGINPEFLPKIVEIASSYNLEVVVHIETEYDVEVAINSGIKHFAHVPFYGYGVNGNVDENYPMLSEDFKKKISKIDDIVFNPTLYRTFLNIKYLPKSKALSAREKELLEEFHIQLLSDLESTNAIIAIGADSPALNALDEAIYYESLGVFPNAILINMLIRNGNLIYPNRKIGCIEESFEANLILTDDNPLDSLSSLKNPTVKIKSGTIIP